MLQDMPGIDDFDTDDEDQMHVVSGPSKLSGREARPARRTPASILAEQQKAAAQSPATTARKSMHSLKVAEGVAAAMKAKADQGSSASAIAAPVPQADEKQDEPASPPPMGKYLEQVADSAIIVQKGRRHLRPKCTDFLTDQQIQIDKDFGAFMTLTHIAHIEEVEDLRYFLNAHVIYDPETKEGEERKIYKLALGASVLHQAENCTTNTFETDQIYIRVPLDFDWKGKVKLRWRHDNDVKINKEYEEHTTEMQGKETVHVLNLHRTALAAERMDIVEFCKVFPRAQKMDLYRRLKEDGYKIEAIHVYRDSIARRIVTHVRAVLPWLRHIAKLYEDGPHDWRKISKPALMAITEAKPVLLGADMQFLYNCGFKTDSRAPWFWFHSTRCVGLATVSVDCMGRDTNEDQAQHDAHQLQSVQQQPETPATMADAGPGAGSASALKAITVTTIPPPAPLTPQQLAMQDNRLTAVMAQLAQLTRVNYGLPGQAQPRVAAPWSPEDDTRLRDRITELGGLEAMQGGGRWDALYSNWNTPGIKPRTKRSLQERARALYKNTGPAQ